MKIAVDCRYIGKSGIGRVCEGILGMLDYSQHEYYLIGRISQLQQYQNAHIVEDNSEPYSKSGLFFFPKQLNKICNAVIIPNFLIPFGVKIPVFTVMHDLAFLDVRQTTRGFFDRKIKSFLLKRCMKKSTAIACVSDFTRKRCVHYYGKRAKKCYTNYIGLSHEVLEYSSLIEKTKSIVFVGNVKPHKGLKTLIEAYRLLPQGEYELKIIGEREGFLTGMKEDELAGDGIIFTGLMCNNALLDEIARASFLIQPSLYEGFGLPPLEALYLGTKPIISDIPVFQEVYQDFPVDYFPVENAQKLARAIMGVKKEIPDVKAKIQDKYSYQKFTAGILNVLEKTISKEKLN